MAGALNVGRSVTNTAAKTPITFAMIELADSPDCNARKSQWQRYSFQDVTPIYGSRSTVPTLSDEANLSDGRQMLQQMASTGADWIMISGHHGALYASDYRAYMVNGKVDTMAVANGEQYCGFFNEWYHQGRWKNSTRTDPDASGAKIPAGTDLTKCLADEIYLRTTDAAPADIASHLQDNPVLDAAAAGVSAPKGIIISACNTLIYKAARTTWSTAFPNAVIIGTISRIVSGTWITNAIASCKMTNEDFWRDPQSILDQPGMCEELSKQLTAGFPRGSMIGFIYKSNLYWPQATQAASDPLTGSL